MKDVSKQTLEDLITFIYRGEVNVNQNDLEGFFNTAKSLKIKGLENGNDAQSKSSCRSTPTKNGFQYQSSRTVQIPTPARSYSASANYSQQSWNDYKQQECFASQASNEMSSNMVNEMVNSFDDDCQGYDYAINDGGDSVLNHKFDAQSDQWNIELHTNAADEKKTDTKPPKAKRAKQANNISKYSLVLMEFPASLLYITNGEHDIRCLFPLRAQIWPITMLLLTY